MGLPYSFIVTSPPYHKAPAPYAFLPFLTKKRKAPNKRQTRPSTTQSNICKPLRDVSQEGNKGAEIANLIYPLYHSIYRERAIKAAADERPKWLRARDKKRREQRDTKLRVEQSFRDELKGFREAA